eukprot:1190298-Prorocentrum_minimum.AAC.3
MVACSSLPDGSLLLVSRPCRSLRESAPTSPSLAPTSRRATPPGCWPGCWQVTGWSWSDPRGGRHSFP